MFEFISNGTFSIVNRSRWRPYDETDVDSIRTKVLNKIFYLLKIFFVFIQESRI